jgi:hypothetical protein
VVVISTGEKAHAIASELSNKFLFVTKLGDDVILQYHFDETSCPALLSFHASNVKGRGAVDPPSAEYRLRCFRGMMSTFPVRHFHPLPIGIPERSVGKRRGLETDLRSGN